MADAERQFAFGHDHCEIVFMDYVVCEHGMLSFVLAARFPQVRLIRLVYYERLILSMVVAIEAL
jgi:hypothetical protein